MNSVFHVSFPGLGIHDLSISREAFSFNLLGYNFSVYWYGIIITAALLICVLLSLWQAPAYNLKRDDILDVFLLTVPFGIIGARLYYVVFAWSEFSGDLSKIFNTRYGGLAFYGAIIGGGLAFFLVAKRKHIPLARLLDFLIVYVPLGQAIGRWGNFFNQEAFGCNTTLPWGMISEGTSSYLARFGNQYAASSAVHPTFFYEFLGNLLIFVILLWVRRNPRFVLDVFTAYMGLYGLLRFFVEGLRTDALMLGQSNIRVSQALSLLMVLAALGYSALALLKLRRSAAVGGEAVLSPPDSAAPEHTADLTETTACPPELANTETQEQEQA